MRGDRPDRSRPDIGWPPTYRSAAVGFGGEHIGAHRALDRGHIGDEGPRPAIQRDGDDTTGDIGWRGNHDEVDLPWFRHDPSGEVGGQGRTGR